MKLVWDDEEVASGFPVEQPIISKDANGKIISVAWVAWFGADNAMANAMNQLLVDGTQAVVKEWSAAKLGPTAQPGRKG